MAQLKTALQQKLDTPGLSQTELVGTFEMLLKLHVETDQLCNHMLKAAREQLHQDRKLQDRNLVTNEAAAKQRAIDAEISAKLGDGGETGADVDDADGADQQTMPGHDAPAVTADDGTTQAHQDPAATSDAPGTGARTRTRTRAFVFGYAIALSPTQRVCCDAMCGGTSSTMEDRTTTMHVM